MFYPLLCSVRKQHDVFWSLLSFFKYTQTKHLHILIPFIIPEFTSLFDSFCVHFFLQQLPLNWINMSLMRWTPGEQTRITLLTPFINSDKYRSNEFTNSETLYESENNSNRVWKREITKLRKSLLYPLSEWAVKAIICLSFHLHTLFVIYVCMWV